MNDKKAVKAVAVKTVKANTVKKIAKPTAKKAAKPTKKPQSAYSRLTDAQKHKVHQYAALKAHTHKTFQTDRNPAERKETHANLAAFIKANPFLREYLAA